jgi:hypothetical protein
MVMNRYNEFKEELSVYENKSKNRIMLAIFIHKFFRLFTTKAFDFIISLAILILIPGFMGGFYINLIVTCSIVHFFYWVVIYRTLSKRFENTMYQDFTLRIGILQDIISRK